MIGSDEDSSPDVGGRSSRPMGAFPPNAIMEPRSPAPAWLSHQTHREEDNNDSGVDLRSPGSEIGNAGSPNSQRAPYQPVNIDYNPLTPPNSSPALPSPVDPDCDVNLEPEPAEEQDLSTEEILKQTHQQFMASISHPQTNSHGKVKIHKCKARGCQYETPIKMDLWKHQKQHMDPERILACQLCPFGSTLKHHIEYHISQHTKVKPFKCEKCSYRCINKSMLTSHMKSHSTVYQYRCRDCSYATKYLHSLKKHLRSYNHQPDVVLDPDGNPNPLPIVDVYGTRRGPKVKTVSGRPWSQPDSQPDPQPAATSQPETPPQSEPEPAVENPELSLFPFPFPNFPQAFFTNAAVQLQLILLEMEKQRRVEPAVAADGALDLSLPGPSSGRPRNMHAFQPLHFRPQAMEDSDDDSDNDMDVQPIQTVQPEESERLIKNEDDKCRCPYCGISFNDPVMHQNHMSYHDRNDPFTCRLCREKCNDKYGFNSHFLHTRH